MTILDQLLSELHEAKGPVSNTELARRLDVSPSALDGMMSVLVSAGRLVGDDGGSEGDFLACSGTACGTTCVGIDDCAFIVSPPRTHHLVIQSAR